MRNTKSVTTMRRMVGLVVLLAATSLAVPPAALVQAVEACVRTRGYWTSHPAEWPIDTLVLGSAANPNHTYTQSVALTLLQLPVRNDASLTLAGQLIATKLNIASGSSAAPIAEQLARADALLGAFAGRLPYGVASRTPIGTDMLATATALEDYNRGLVPGSCGIGNRAPAADAGPDQTVVIGRLVTLDGSGSTDLDGDPLTFRWTMVSMPAGSTATLSDPAAVKPTFVADMHGSYDIQLVVNDGALDSAPDAVLISTINSAPAANAGLDQTLPVGSLVQLDGTGSSDPDGDALSFSWAFVSRPAASQAVLSGASSVNPVFTIDGPGVYEIELVVSDGSAASLPDRVVISTSNSAPTADAGADTTARVGEVVTLDGSQSRDVDGDALTFNWSLVSIPAGSTAALSDLGAVRPTFVIDRPGDYVAQLVVHDGLVPSDPDSVVVSTLNSRPVADAGADIAILVGAVTVLDGSGSSDIDGDPLTFAWSLTSRPSGSTAALSDPAAVNPTLVPDMAGTYVAQLVVNDGALDSEPDTVTLTTGNRMPVADAGPDQTVALGATAQLDGTGSLDPDGDPLTFTWSLLSTPAGSTATISDPASASPTFLVDARGNYVAQLLVADGTLTSQPSTVTISTENSRPIADAGTNQTVETGATVQLDGSASADPDGTPLLYAWSILSQPAGSAAALSDPIAAMPTFVADVDGLYVVQLQVGDGVLLSDPDTTTITAASDADVAIEFVNPPAGTIAPGANVGFSIRVSNFGPLAADAVAASVQLPAGFSGVTATASLGTYDLATGTWTIGALEANEDAELAIQVIVNSMGSLALAASITNSSRSDPDPTNNVANAPPANRPPVASAGADRQVTAGATAILDGSASTDPDGDQLTFQWTFTARPAGSAATLSGAATAAPSFVADAVGPFVAQLVVMDPAGASATDSVIVTAAANRPPIITSSPVTAGAVAEPYVYAVTAIDPDAGDVLTFSLPIAPAGMSIDPASGVVQWTPAGTQSGVNHVAVHVRDRVGLLSAQGFSVDVAIGAGNVAPQAQDDAYDARTGDSLSIAAPGVLGNDTDPDGNRLSARALSQPDNGNLAFNRDGSFVYTPFTFSEGELVLSENVNLASNVTGVTVTASSSQSAGSPGGAAQNAVDGSLATSWRSHPLDSPSWRLDQSLTGGPPFIEVTFPEAVQVSRMQVVGHRDPFLTNFKIFAGKFQLFDGDGAEIFDSGIVDLPLPDRDGMVSVPDLFTKSRNVARTVSGATYSASATRAGRTAADAFDGNFRTEWASPFNMPGPQFLEVAFPADVTVHRVNIFGNRTEPTIDFLAFEVQVFDAAGALAFTSGTISVTAATSDTSVAVGGVTGRRVRVIGSQQQSTNLGGGIAELQVISTETVTTPLNNTVRRARFTGTAAAGDPSGVPSFPSEVGLAEFRVMGSAQMRRVVVAEPNLAYRLPTAVSASSFSPGNFPENAIDGTVRNWYAISGGAGEFLELEFPLTATVREIQALNASATPGGFGSSIGLNCSGSFLLIGEDGSTLFDSGVVPSPVGFLADPTPFTLAVPDVAGVKRMRYVSAGCVSGSQPTGFAEVRVLGEADVITPPISVSTKFHTLPGREVHTTPVVVNLTDDNGDGRIDEHDVPDIVVTAEQTTNQLKGEIKVFSGDDGRELFTAGAPDLVSPWAEPAAADLDGDGRVEIVAVHSDGNHLIAFDNTGQIKWVSDAHALPRFAADTRFVASAISIANLDETGPPEIIVGASVFSADGHLLADGRTLKGTTGGTGLRSAISAVADIDLDGAPELVAGPTAYRFAGGSLSIAWQRTDRGDAYTGIANLDDDPFAEIVSVANGAVYVLNHDGTDAPFWNPPTNAPVPIPGGGMGGAPTIADLDGDGIPEIGVAGAGYFVVFNRDGSVRWQAVVSDRTSNSTGATVFDLDGDGSVEVIYRDELHLRIYRGSDGLLLAMIRLGSSTWAEMPVVADVDNDGHADVVVTSDRFLDNTLRHTGVYVFQDVANRWVRTRRIWNQHSYHVTNVNEDGSIPVEEQPHFLIPELNSFRLNRLIRQLGDDNTDVFQYVASDGALESLPATVRLSVRTPNSSPRITSTGVADAASDVPYLYAAQAIDPDAGDILTFSLPTSPAGMSIDAATGLVTWTPAGSQLGPHQVVVKVQDLRGQYALQGYSVLVSAPVAVPDVVGTLQTAAESAIAAATLTVGTIGTRHSPTVPADSVISQTPAAGTLVAPHAAVDLLVSQGPAPAGTVPDVVGQQQSAAQVDIVAAGFVVGSVGGEHRATVPAGVVLGQNPAGGSQANLGSAISLLVSLGVPPGDRDLDGDGFTGNQGDCDDTDPFINPAAFDVPGDGIDQNCNGVDSIAGDTTPPVATLESPADLAEVTMPVDIVGTATDVNFLRYALLMAEVDAASETTIGSGTAPVTSGVLGRLDPTLLENGLYRVRLVVEDVNGQISVDERVYRVDGMMKAGNFRLSFTDLSIPVAGIPITITRTYDSRVKTKEDFGIGWTLDIKRGSYRHNRTPGQGWIIRDQPFLGQFLPCIGGSLETRSHLTEVRLSDRESYRFALEITNGNLGITGACEGTAQYRFISGPTSGATLEILDGTGVIYLRGGDDTVLDMDAFLEGANRPYDPQRVRLRTVDGRTIEFERTRGIANLEDNNGNRLTIGAAGIVHSSGASISFTRDAQGRVTRIVDPRGHALEYAYEKDDLTAFTDQSGTVTTFTYDDRHNLLEIIDPQGNRGVLAEFDPDGRLVAVTDAHGARTSFDHNVDGREEVVVDALGRPSRFVYDERGNVLAREQTVIIDGAPVVARSQHQYDAFDNEISVTDPDGIRAEGVYDETRLLEEVVDPTGLALRTVRSYDARGELLTQTDPAGATTTFGYDARGNLTAYTDAGGTTTSLSYGAGGLPTESRDALGTRTRLAFDAQGRVSQRDQFDVTGGLLSRTLSTYDANGNLTSSGDVRSVNGVLNVLTTHYVYDGRNRLIAVIDPLGHVTQTEYNALGRVGATVDALGRRTTFAYDEVGALVRTDFPDGTFETRTYDALGNLVNETDRAGRVTSFEYDELRRRVRVVRPDGSSSRTVYTPAGREAAVLDARGYRTDYLYDTAGRRTRTIHPPVRDASTGVTVRPEIGVEYDVAGRVAAIVDANGRRTAFSYDAMGRLIRREFADGSSKVLAFDALGRLAEQRDEAGRLTRFEHDPLGRLARVIDALGGVTAYAYDEAGLLIGQTDALGRTTRHVRDAVGRQVRRVLPGGGVEAFAYDAAGNTIAHTDFNGSTTVFRYDPMNRPFMRAHADGSTVTFAYTPTGRRASATDARGVTSYEYDVNDRLVQVTHPAGEVVRYAYDEDGSLRQLATAAATVDYERDAVGRLVNLSAHVSGVDVGSSTYAYDLVGNLVEHTRPNGVATRRTYDERNRMTDIEHQSAGGPIGGFAYQLSPTGRRTRVTETNGGVVHYGYDALDRLISEVVEGGSAVAYEYDATGNRTRMSRDGAVTAYAYDDDDRLLTAGAAGYTYDASGNLRSKTLGGLTTTYEWGADDRLVRVNAPGATVAFGYDADGNRVTRQIGSNVSRVLVDANNPTGLPQVLEERDGFGNLMAHHVYGAGPESATRDGSTVFYQTDGLNSTRLLTDASGAVTDRYQFDAFGTLTAATGSTVNTHLFTGEQFEPATGLYNLRARDYDPAVGRFTSRDPFPGRAVDPRSQHPYVYAHGDPVNNTDPTGLFTLLEIGSALGVQDVLRSLDLATTAARYCTLTGKLEVAQEAIFWAQFAAAGPILASEIFGTRSSDASLDVTFAARRFLNVFNNPEKIVAAKASLKFTREGDRKLGAEFTREDGLRFGGTIDFVNPGNSSFKTVAGAVAFEFAPGNLAGSSVGIKKSFQIFEVERCTVPLVKGSLEVGAKVSGKGLAVSAAFVINALLDLVKFTYPLLELP